MINMVKKKAREEIWDYTTAGGKKAKQELISHYANPDFVRVVEESKDHITKNVSTAKKNREDKRKNSENSKKS